MAVFLTVDCVAVKESPGEDKGLQIPPEIKI